MSKVQNIIQWHTIIYVQMNIYTQAPMFAKCITYLRKNRPKMRSSMEQAKLENWERGWGNSLFIVWHYISRIVWRVLTLPIQKVNFKRYLNYRLFMLSHIIISVTGRHSVRTKTFFLLWIFKIVYQFSLFISLDDKHKCLEV